MTPRRRPVFALSAAAAAALVSTFGFFFFRDNFATHYPVKVLSAESWRSLEIPYWNFADGGGQPLAGNPNTLSFYPDNVLYLFLPAHVAFNLHFLLHLVAGWLAMRALTRSRFGAWLWALSGAAMSACAFYNLVPSIALIPLAFLAAERRSAPQLGLAFGLLALAGEPVTMLATAIAVTVILSRASPAQDDRGNLVVRLASASALALLIASPQLIAYAEIAREVERARGFSAATALAASFDPRRLLEILIGPVIDLDAPHLFPSLVIGVIAIPAIFRRSRYAVVAAVSLFFALGAFNPAVRLAVESFPPIRIIRFPEKFALVLCAALVVLIADYVRESRTPRIWTIVTFAPLLFWCVRTMPIDWWSPYRLDPSPPRRLFVPYMAGGQELDRAEFHERVRRREPLFGATAGLEYVLNRSPDGMHSLLSRIAAERFAFTHNPVWLRLATAPTRVLPNVLAAATVPDAVNALESAPEPLDVAPRSFTSSPGAHVMRVARDGQTITIDLVSPGPAIIATDQTYFSAWQAAMDGRAMPIAPVNLDRLGVVVPHGGRIMLRFGRHRVAVAVAWAVSLLALLGTAAATNRRRNTRSLLRPDTATLR